MAIHAADAEKLVFRPETNILAKKHLQAEAKPD